MTALTAAAKMEDKRLMTALTAATKMEDKQLMTALPAATKMEDKQLMTALPADTKMEDKQLWGGASYPKDAVDRAARYPKVRRVGSRVGQFFGSILIVLCINQLPLMPEYYF